ncbi:MAG: hemerythrin domain-containing protein [Flavisolibacter sp.]
MEQKPIKRSEHIKQLSKDHHFTLLFSWKIRQGLKHEVDGDRIKKYVAHFWKHDMKPHFLEEEKILFAPVKDDQVQKAIDDHRKIERQVDTVLQSPADKVSEQLLQLAGLVDAHVRFEERELFPHLEKTLTPAQLEVIGEQLHNEPLLQDNYQDEFWIKQK